MKLLLKAVVSLRFTLARSKSLATSLMLCAKAKTRQLLCDCSSALRTSSSQVCRAGGIEPYESVCQRHFDKIRREDDRTCSCPSSWGHFRKINAHPVPTRYYQILDQVGRSSASSYNPGTRWCNKCSKEAPKRFKNWPQLEEDISEVCFNDTVLKKRWRKCPHFHIVRVFLKNNYFLHKHL